jgi:hypothetical protein
VDPTNVFVSWEITEEQLAAARTAMGAAFGVRKLHVEIALAEAADHVIARSELFGDTGRWFLELPPVGQAITAQLYFAAAGTRFDLLRAGPVQLPRTTPVEPEHLEELHVS